MIPCKNINECSADVGIDKKFCSECGYPNDRYVAAKFDMKTIYKRDAKLRNFKKQHQEQVLVNLLTKEGDHLGRQMAKIRTIKGITVGMLADISGVGANTINNFEKKRSNTPIDIVHKLAFGIGGRVEFVGWEH